MIGNATILAPSHPDSGGDEAESLTMDCWIIGMTRHPNNNLLRYGISWLNGQFVSTFLVMDKRMALILLAVGQVTKPHNSRTRRIEDKI